MTENASSSIYTPGSEASHTALQGLRVVLDHLGFKVAKKPLKEDTLRVYPAKFRQYPLLNPRFVRGPYPGLRGRGFLEVTVLSKGDDYLDNRLRSYAAKPDSVFIPVGSEHANYFVHGQFALPLPFQAQSRSQEIDFVALGSALKDLLHFLRHAG